MSHLALVELVVQDLEILQQVAQELGMEFMPGKKTYQWYGTIVGDSAAYKEALKKGFKQSDFGKCSHAIRTNDRNAYEIGVVENPDGNGYSLLYDSWGPGQKIEALAGVGLCKLSQLYAAEVAMREIVSQGFSVQRIMNENNEVQLIGTN